MDVGIAPLHNVLHDRAQGASTKPVSIDAAPQMTERIQRGRMANHDAVAVFQPEPFPCRLR